MPGLDPGTHVFLSKGIDVGGRVTPGQGVIVKGGCYNPPPRRPSVREEDTPFVASNGLTEAGTSRTVAAGGMTVHYHDVGEGEPVLFLHSYGPGTTAWITQWARWQ